jgi:hypothetical protein
MIQFICPRCDSTLSTSSRKGGSVCACPKCKYRLQVPPAANGVLELDTDVEPVPVTNWAKKARFCLRLAAWAGCLSLVALIARPYLGFFNFEEAPATDLTAAGGPIVLLVGAYIAARAVDSLTHW